MRTVLPRAKPEEDCKLRGQIYEHIFAPNGGLMFIVLQIFSTRGKKIYEELTVYVVECLLLVIDFMNKKYLFLPL